MAASSSSGLHPKHPSTLAGPLSPPAPGWLLPGPPPSTPVPRHVPSKHAGQTIKVANYNVGAKNSRDHSAGNKKKKLLEGICANLKYLELMGVSVVLLEDIHGQKQPWHIRRAGFHSDEGADGRTQGRTGGRTDGTEQDGSGWGGTLRFSCPSTRAGQGWFRLVAVSLRSSMTTTSRTSHSQALGTV